MLEELTLERFLSHRSAFSLVIDVRSPHEYLESHLPGALNLPVLSDLEHERVGTLYKESPFEARILGASLICANIASALSWLKDSLHPSQKVLIYCARGGQRSLSLALILSSIGYQIARLIEGYKGYRAHVAASWQAPRKESFLTLVGPTGGGKSELIQSLPWSLDIEGLARHKGSSFGAIKGEQPSTKMFQNLLFERLLELREEPLIAVEGESKRLGNLILPSSLYERYKSAPKVFIDSPLEARIDRTMQEYASISPAFFEGAMQKIARYMNKEAHKAASLAFWQGDLRRCAELLLVEYYDKVYKMEPCEYTIFHTSKESTLKELERIKGEVLSSVRE